MTVMPYPLLAPVAKYGYLGVHLFFIISGFVILMTAANGSLRSFLISRLVRLYPAFWACCTITALFIVAIGAPRFNVSLAKYLINMTMLNEYFGVPSVDGAYWSLFVEMRFYALVCVVLLMRKIHQAQFILTLWLIASVALQMMPSYRLSQLLITSYSAFFIAGATFYLIWSEGFSIPKFGIVILSWGLAVFRSVNDLQDFEKHFNTGMSGFIVAGIITLFFMAMLLVSLKGTGIFGQTRWIIAGSLTYPLYLLHQNIGFILFNIAYPAINVHVIFWGTLFLMIGAAYVVHNFIEKRLSSPMINTIDNLLGSLGWKKKKQV